MLAATFVVCQCPLQTVWTQIRTDRMPVLIWIQTVWHSDNVPERLNFEKKSADNNKSMNNYPACKVTLEKIRLDVLNPKARYYFLSWKCYLLSTFAAIILKPRFNHGSKKHRIRKCQNMPEYAEIFRKMPVNASGMDFTHKCRHFPNPNANPINPDQTAPLRAVWSGSVYCL